MNKTAVSEELAADYARAIKEWAETRGVTHYTHWFQPNRQVRRGRTSASAWLSLLRLARAALAWCLRCPRLALSWRAPDKGRE